MKRFRNKILSILLFSFSILIIHDFMIVDINNNYEVSCETLKKAIPDCPACISNCSSKIHTQIHLTMDVPRKEVNIVFAKYKNGEIFETLVSFCSHVNPVLLRPPTA